MTTGLGSGAALLLLLLLTGPASLAQTPGSGGPTPGTPAADPTAVPLDGGASLLLLAGAGVGLRALRRRTS
ncbi:hypothetical protein LJ737_24895 [Hymenobacter sp. 15J16-1T3B]|uniref:PID-CTERM protein-sorting domain-containing protein n=1 Tax=Hymenobacter sp. 15J16-1T3B TaxID=2886941 RepID=UPI001D123CFD|nr:hypothetical protein [Hymenobacter sp. 15J16-1T3B]MCC3160498.1 hypothetical protein [Hymenobacter sp. 15J16-1T3B]